MNLSVPSYIQNLKPYVPGKPIEETQREYGIKRIVKLASNENPLGPSPRALRAVQKCLKDSHRYPDASAFRLKEALSAFLNVSKDELLIGNGSNEVIDLVIRAYCQPGDRMLSHQASFVAYKICAQIQGVETVEVPINAELRPSLAEMLDQIRRDKKIKMVFLANPNNPTGAYFSGNELRAFLRDVFTVRNGSVLVVLDYAYWEYVRTSEIPDPMEIYKEFPHVVILRTFSKIYGLAGFRMGYGIARSEITSVLGRIRQPFNVSSLGLVAAEEALHDKVFVERSRKLNIAGMRWWEEKLAALEIPFWKSQGNFLLVDTQRGIGKPGGEVYLSCLQKGVIFRPVANYGLLNALRITIGTPEENKWAIQALAQEKTKGPKKEFKKSPKRKKPQ